MSYSVRKIEEALGLSHKIVHDAPAPRMQAIATLREKQLLVDVGEREKRKKGTFYIKGR